MRRRKSDHRKRSQDDLATAEKSLAQASAARSEQASKREHEMDTLMTRLDRLAAGNHLAEKLLEAFTERYT